PPGQRETVIRDEGRVPQVLQLGAVDYDKAVGISPGAPRWFHDASDMIGMILLARKMEPAPHGIARVAALAHFTGGELERVFERKRVREQLVAARVFLKLVEHRAQRRIARVGAARIRASLRRDSDWGQLDRQSAKRDAHGSGVADDDLCVERREADLSDTEQVGSGGGDKAEGSGGVAELPAAVRKQRHDAETEGLTRFGGDDGAAERRVQC